MRLPKRFFRVQLAAQRALLTSLLTIAVIVVASSAIWNTFKFPLGSAGASFSLGGALISLLYMTIAGYVFAVVPVIVYGAPLYALAESKGRATWTIVIAIGALPGVVLMANASLTSQPATSIAQEVAAIALATGILTAIGTHLKCRKEEGFVGAA